ncbi:MAG: diacylglycerol kinase family protein [Candidatus Acidiferrales bacterium]
MKAETLVIVNPTAGGGRALRAEASIAKLLQLRGHPADFVHSKSSADSRDQAEQGAREGYRYVVALGGDGAFHHLVEAVRGTETVAGFFPAGNGNDIAADLGIPADPLDAAEAFLKSAPRAIDLIRARFGDGRMAHYIGAGGMGLDAEAAHLANTKFRRSPGVMRYLAGAFWEFFQGGSIGLQAEIDGVAWDGQVLFVAVANSTRYGSGIRIAPEAKMDDGWIDVALVQEIGLARLVDAIPIVLTSGDLRGFPELRRYRCRRIVLQTEHSVKVHGDGELLGETPVELTVLPQAVRVMTPKAREGESA